jgi:hypothetical protein
MPKPVAQAAHVEEVSEIDDQEDLIDNPFDDTHT